MLRVASLRALEREVFDYGGILCLYSQMKSFRVMLKRGCNDALETSSSATPPDGSPDACSPAETWLYPPL